MKKLTLLSVVVSTLLFVGCGGETKEAAKATEAAPAAEKSTVEKATEAASSVVAATKEAATKAAEKTAEVAKEAVESTKEVASKAAEVAKEAVAEKATEVKKAVEEKVEEAKGAAVDTKACAGCHGADFEKKAMGKSKIVKDMSKDDIIKALKGYKDGSYGGAMKGLMKGQVASFDDAKIEAVAAQIAK